MVEIKKGLQQRIDRGELDPKFGQPFADMFDRAIEVIIEVPEAPTKKTA